MEQIICEERAWVWSPYMNKSGIVTGVRGFFMTSQEMRDAVEAQHAACQAMNPRDPANRFTVNAPQVR